VARLGIKEAIGKISGSVWESNPPVPISGTHAALKAGEATGLHALPVDAVK